MKQSNQYAEVFKDFDKIPKAVFAAVCASLIDCMENAGNWDNPEHINYVFLNEWRVLHLNGIVPQKPFKGKP